RRSRQLMKTRYPKSGYQPLVETMGRAARREAATTVAAGKYAAKGEGLWLNLRDGVRAARTIRAPLQVPAHFRRRGRPVRTAARRLQSGSAQGPGAGAAPPRRPRA